MLAYFLLESNEIMLLLMKEKEEEWFCFIQEAKFHFIDKQLLLIIRQMVSSCLGIARSY